MSVEGLSPLRKHPSEDSLEEYSFGRIQDPALSNLEEHLLICEPCQSKLAELDEYRVLMRVALKEYEARPIIKHELRLSAFAAIAAGIILVVGAAVGGWLRPTPKAPTEVTLLAMRGAPDGMSHTLAGRPLDISIDLTSLPRNSRYLVQIVDGRGKPGWTGQPSISGTGLLIKVPAGFRTGLYWVRLYSSSGELLREYGLRLD